MSYPPPQIAPTPLLAVDNRQRAYRQLAILARADFWTFVAMTFPVLYPNDKLVRADYLEYICYILMAAESGNLTRAIFNLPPRHMKSLLVSVLFPAWAIGRNPSAKFLCISYGDDLAHDHSASTRKVLQSLQYQLIFPKTILDKKAVDHIKTTAGDQRYATSVGSDIIGFGADFIIIDDPMQPDESTSETAKNRILSWVQNSVMTRFNDPKTGVLMLVMHRLAPDDLSSTLEASNNYYLVKLPLIAEVEEEFCIEDFICMKRSPGDVLNPQRMNKDDVKKLQTGLTGHVFDSQYQQRPTVGGSGMLSLSAFKRFDLEKSPKFDFLIQSWDLGATVSGNASVCTTWGIVRGQDGVERAFLIDLLLIKVQLPTVIAAIKARDKKDGPALIIIDDRGIGLGVYQQLKADGFSHVTGAAASSGPYDRDGQSGILPNAGKIQRFGYACHVIACGRVLLPNSAPWLENFLYEVAAFPNIPDDDQVDSMTQLLAYFDRATKMARNNFERR